MTRTLFMLITKYFLRKPNYIRIFQIEFISRNLPGIYFLFLPPSYLQLFYYHLKRHHIYEDFLISSTMVGGTLLRVLWQPHTPLVQASFSLPKGHAKANLVSCGVRCNRFLSCAMQIRGFFTQFSIW